MYIVHFVNTYLHNNTELASITVCMVARLMWKLRINSIKTKIIKIDKQCLTGFKMTFDKRQKDGRYEKVEKSGKSEKSGKK